MKKETVAEYLARGGKITQVPASATLPKAESIKSTTPGGPAVIVTMEEADLYHGEYKPRKSKKKIAASTIDLSALPPELRKKYVDEVIYGQEEDSKSSSNNTDNT